MLGSPECLYNVWSIVYKAVQIEKERMASPKLTREIVIEKKGGKLRGADLLINCSNFMSSI